MYETFFEFSKIILVSKIASIGISLEFDGNELTLNSHEAFVEYSIQSFNNKLVVKVQDALRYQDVFEFTEIKGVGIGENLTIQFTKKHPLLNFDLHLSEVEVLKPLFVSRTNVKAVFMTSHVSGFT